MLILKDDLSIELFDIDELELSIEQAIISALDGAIGYGAGDAYRSSGVVKVTAEVTYYILKMGCACTAQEIRSFVAQTLNTDERRHYAESYKSDSTSDGILPDVPVAEPSEGGQPD